MPVPGAAIRLGPCGTGLSATFQATTCRRSRRGVSRYAAGTLPCGSNHVRYTRDTPSPLGLSPHTGPAVARPPLKKGQPSAPPSPFGLIPKGWPGLRPANGLNSRPYPPCRRARAAPVARGKPASRNARACGPVSHRCAPWIRADGMSRARSGPDWLARPAARRARTRARRGEPLTWQERKEPHGEGAGERF
jgi:hypothetical protein